MRNQILFITLFLLCSTTFFSQDLLIKKDSSKLEVKLLEVNPLSLKFKLYSNLNGPDYIIDKKEVALIIYQNGIQEVINITENLNQIGEQTAVNANAPKESKKRDVKLKDYVNFNLQAGVVINNSYCNKPRKDDFPPSHTSSEWYYGYSKKNNVNINLGFNFVLGSNAYIKHIIGVNYLRSKGEFNYYYSGVARSQLNGYEWRTYSEDLRYYSTIDYINFVTGLRFTICKKFHVEPCIAFNYMANSNVKVTGYRKTIDYNTYSSGLAPLVQNNYFENESYRSDISSTVSLCPKLTYEFKIKEQKIGIYYSYNISYEYRLPWNMIGITYYPFKKLRS